LWTKTIGDAAVRLNIRARRPAAFARGSQKAQHRKLRRIKILIGDKALFEIMLPANCINKLSRVNTQVTLFVVRYWLFAVLTGIILENNE